MKGVLIGLGVSVAIVAGVFALLVLMADAGAPEPSEIRIEVSDDLRDPG
jgi:hypothetical protein